MNADSYSARDGRLGASRDYSSRDDRRDRGDRGDRRDRRRSRSPRRSHRDEDAYASSRSHRDREREDRYGGAGRDRREREWDRDRGDRGARREHRREEPPRPSRRDRDGYGDDRRGGGERRDRGGRDRDEDLFAQNRRGRSASPPKKREPTPDLTDVVPVLERKRRMTQWDIKPPGYDNVTAEQAKLSGMFPLPGAPRQQPMDPTRLQAFMNHPGGAVNSAALKPGNSRQSKRLLVSNLPPGTTDDSVIGFFNIQLNGLNVVESTDPCILCQISKDHSFALLEFRHASEATVALALDGISMEADDAMNGAASAGLHIKRPKDYIVPAVAEDTPYEPGVVSKVVIDTPNKISISNIPPYLADEQVTELLVAFGELKAFVLVKDNGTEESRGIAFCEFVDPSITDIAVQGLNGMVIGEKNLKVQKASIGITQVSGVEMGVNAMSMLAGTTASNDSEISRVVQLLNMVTPEELLDNDDYEEICEDVEGECAKYGNIVAMKVPRPIGGSRQSAGVGKIFVKFDTTESATKALQALAGRKFADRTVVTTYFPEENFEVGAW
ncbi:hypothetical protein F5B22DRAFT_609604 [Xylaria bambusicola]|uniref:uncharacterized protein n=1 Tax=Xylaria bambusicola TaxID=326684 RepID=UPI002007CBD6|nr:uncharacterized protein F5B22DRAFT_609604 [Xylaria bambusicola]KAI0514783.1 hypothetical protein F5B22DRAFT_609604 [Xylaria bambusicola]